MKEGFLLVLSGPSGVGKGTVSQALLEELDELIYSISITTRKARPNEVDGENYFFVSVDQYKEMVANDQLLEHAQVHGNYYGTPRDFVKDKIDQGKIVLLEIDVQGALQIKKNVDDAVFVFLLPPTMSELRSRILKRGTESSENIAVRFSNAFKELDFVEEYDYYVINRSVDEAVFDVKTIIEAEKLRVIRSKAVVKEILKG